MHRTCTADAGNVAEDAVGQDSSGDIRKIADGIEYTMPATIEDPVTLEDMGRALSKLGYPRKV